ncbi:MAG: hypothetical protein HPY69_12355 [Armatimonadetes bacterium]|nr:hypothetical protein [Armatimonadota bacterium]
MSSETATSESTGELIRAAETAIAGVPLRLQRLLIAYFLLVIGIVPLAQVYAELRTGESVQVFDVFRQVPTVEALTAYERQLEKRSVVAAPVRRFLQWLGLVTLRTGNQKALVGPTGVLFYKPSLEAAVRPGFMAAPQAQGHPLPAIVAWHEALAAAGVKLVVLACPGKEAIYPEWLDPGYDLSRGPAVNPDLDHFVATLRQRGVTVIEPTDLLWSQKHQGELYLHQDTHWSPLGMRLVADEVARHVPRPIGRRQEFALQEAEVVAYGDLYEMLQLPDLPTPLLPQRVRIERVVHVASGDPVEPDDGAPVVLLGDSFTNIYSVPEMGWGDHAGLGEQLAYRLGCRLDIVAMNDGGVNRARVAFARRGDPLRGKRVVIWQFAARDLVVSNGDWETIAIGRKSKE